MISLRDEVASYFFIWQQKYSRIFVGNVSNSRRAGGGARKRDNFVGKIELNAEMILGDRKSTQLWFELVIIDEL